MGAESSELPELNEERKFLHAIASPVCTGMFFLDVVLENLRDQPDTYPHFCCRSCVSLLSISIWRVNRHGSHLCWEDTDGRVTLNSSGSARTMTAGFEFVF